MSIVQYGRYWKVVDADGVLVCATVYKRGALEVIRRLQSLDDVQQRCSNRTLGQRPWWHCPVTQQHNTRSVDYEPLPTWQKLVLRLPVPGRAVEGRYELPSKKPSPKLADFVEEYFAYYRANRRPRSVRRHLVSWHAIQPICGKKRLAEISPFELERYRRQRKQDGRSDVTINRELAFLRNLYSMAITWEKAAENPVKKVRLARENNGRMRLLAPEEEPCLLECCRPTLKPLVLAALHTGFRASELLSLTWEGVDFRRRAITVRAAYAKTGESRSVPMNEVLTRTLQAVRITVSTTGPVFCSRQGTPYRSFRTAFEHAVRQAGIVDLTLHDLGHTFASRLVMGGVDLPTVQALMGHKDISMTLRYTHLTGDHTQRAVRVLETFAEKSQQCAQQGRGQGTQSVHKLLKVRTLS